MHCLSKTRQNQNNPWMQMKLTSANVELPFLKKTLRAESQGNHRRRRNKNCAQGFIYFKPCPLLVWNSTIRDKTTVNLTRTNVA